MRAPILRAAWPLILLGSITPSAHADEHPGAHFFQKVLPGSNGRSCATCHVLDVEPGVAPRPRLVPHDSEFLNIGFGLLSGYGQLGILPMSNASVTLPRYRFRFYTDGTRRELITDLPPIPLNASEPFDPTPALDERGAPSVGPSLANQWFSTPGRAIVTGNPLDLEAFDVPQLRGIAHTAPYFHDNSVATLPDAVDAYSRFILSFFPFDLPVHPPESEGGPQEALSRAQKDDLLAFLRRL